MTPVKVTPTYGSIEAIRDICKPWIKQWEGDEWGESMWNLYRAAHIDYGPSDEDCATIAEILARNVIRQHHWAAGEGESYGLMERVDTTEAKARERRDYWLKGGNLGDEITATQARESIESLPAWMFGES